MGSLSVRSRRVGIDDKWREIRKAHAALLERDGVLAEEFEEDSVKVLVAMVEAKCQCRSARNSLFDIKIEESARQASVLGQAHLRIAPKRLDPVDMVGSSSEFVSTVVDSEMAFVAQIDEPVVAAPAIGVDDTLIGHSALNDRFQCRSGAIVEHVGEDFTSAFVDADDRHFASCPSSAFTAHTLGSEVALVDFDDSLEGRSSVALCGDTNAHGQQMAVHAGAMNADQVGNFDRFEIQAKELVEEPELSIRKSRTFAVAIGH